MDVKLNIQCSQSCNTAESTKVKNIEKQVSLFKHAMLFILLLYIGESYKFLHVYLLNNKVILLFIALAWRRSEHIPTIPKILILFKIRNTYHLNLNKFGSEIPS